MKRNPFSVKRVILIFLLCLVSNSIMAQTVNLDTLDLDQLNLYKHKAVATRKVGMILTLSGVSLVIVSNIVGFTIANMRSDDPDDPYNEPFGGGFVAGAYIILIGNGVGLASTVVGIPTWAIGVSRKKKAEISLQKFNIPPENSMALGLGITLRF